LYFAIHAKDHGLPTWTAGTATAIGIAAEAAVLWFGPQLLQRFSIKALMTALLCVTAVRWCIMALPLPVAVLLPLQLLHGFTFGAWAVALIAYLAEATPRRLRAGGQALMWIVVFAGGSVFGNALMGPAYDAWGTEALYLGAGGIEVIALLLFFCTYRPPRLIGG
jgi:PPP family 3-phenylpropionic acid transporter